MVDLARPDGGKLRTCTILTTAANSALAGLHDRMPVILAPGAEAQWLDTSTPARRASMRSWPACPPTRPRCDRWGCAVNDARYDGPECLAPPAPDPQAALF